MRKWCLRLCRGGKIGAGGILVSSRTQVIDRVLHEECVEVACCISSDGLQRGASEERHIICALGSSMDANSVSCNNYPYHFHCFSRRLDASSLASLVTSRLQWSKTDVDQGTVRFAQQTLQKASIEAARWCSAGTGSRAEGLARIQGKLVSSICLEDLVLF